MNKTADRLQRAAKQIELARTSRDLKYEAIPYVIAAEELLKKAILIQTPDSPFYKDWS